MKILVVLNAQHREEGVKSLLLRKAAVLAAGLGASLELLRVVYERSANVSMFLAQSAMTANRRQLLEAEREWVAEVADRLRAQGLSVSWDVRWGHPRAEAIVGKVRQHGYHWVLKEASDDHYLLGLFSNTDWDLLRECPAPVYFVKGGNPPGAGVLVALEGFAEDEQSEAAALDYHVFREARRISEAFATPLTLVHAYQVPYGLVGFAGYAPLMSDLAALTPEAFESLSESERHEKQTVAERHGRAIHAFAEHFDYPVNDIVIREGAPDLVISEEAHKRQCGLVVMGAGEAGLLDRLFRQVTAEPTLAEAECDILFVKPHQANAEGDAAADTARETHVDREALRDVLGDPSGHFDAPGDVLGDERFSDYEKRRILRAWEHDALQLMVADEEGVPARGPEPATLDAVRTALRRLRD